MNQPVVLLYGIPVQEKIPLMQVLLREQCRVVTVNREQYQVPLGILAGMKTAKESFPEDTGRELPEPMMVFCGFADDRLDLLLAGLRQAGVKVDLKAVLTPYNQTWTSRMLYYELSKERQAFLSGKNKK